MTDALKQARDALPPLPEPAGVGMLIDYRWEGAPSLDPRAAHPHVSVSVPAYTADQMREYARAAIARADAAQPNPRSHLSWAGFNVHGDTPSINEVQRVLHEAGTVPELKATIRALYAAQATPVAGWISVDDSLPPKFTEVLIAFAGQNTLASTGQWTDNHKHDVRGWCYPAENRGCTDGGDDPVVTHWMPLPDVPLTPRCDKPAAPPAPAAQTEPTGARGLIADMLSAMEYHVEQTRPVQSTTWAIEAAREFLKAAPAGQEPAHVALAWLKKRRDNYLADHASTDPDTGALEFGRGEHAERKREYVSELDEIIEGLEALSCDRPPAGWVCSRAAGHVGPCAATMMAQQEPAQAADEFAWLVEIRMPGTAPQWLGFCGPSSKSLRWCHDANDAVRLARKADAEQLRRHYLATLGFLGNHAYEAQVTVTEHGWTAPPTTTPAPAAQEPARFTGQLFLRAQGHPRVLEIMADCADCIETENDAQSDGPYDGSKWRDLAAELRAKAEAIRAEDPELWEPAAQQEPAQADAREALTNDQVWIAVGAALDDSMVKLKDVLPLARAIERAHSIGQAKPAGGAL